MELGLMPFAWSDDFSICVYNVATVCLIGVTDVVLKTDWRTDPLEGVESLCQHDDRWGHNYCLFHRGHRYPVKN